MRPAGSDHRRQAANAVPKFAQSLRRQITERIFFLCDIAESRPFHLPGGSAESFGTQVVHINEAECLGKWYPVSCAVQELDLCSHFPKHSDQIHCRQCPLRNNTVGEDGRTSGKGEALNYSNKLVAIDGE